MAGKAFTTIRKDYGRPEIPLQEQIDKFKERLPVFKVAVARNGKWYSSTITNDTFVCTTPDPFIRKRGLLHEYEVGKITQSMTMFGIYCCWNIPIGISRQTYTSANMDIIDFRRKFGLCAILKCYPENMLSDPDDNIKGICRTSAVYVDCVFWKGYEFPKVLPIK